MSAPAAVAALAAAAAELRLLVRCHEHVLALGATGIERILLADEVAAPVPTAALGVYPNAPRSCLGVLTAAGSVWAAWDLALLLELPPVGAAWLLLQRPHGGGMLRLALRSDRCLHVGRLIEARMLVLAPGIARARPGLVRGAFPVQPLHLRQQGDAPVGLDLDLAALWSPAELSLAQELIACAGTPAGGEGDGPA